MSTIFCWADSTSLTRTGPMYCMSSSMSWAARSDMFLKILSLSSCAGGLEGQGQLLVVDFLEHRLNALVVDQQDVLEDEHEPANLLDQIGVLGFQAFHDSLFRGAVGEVENLGDGVDAAGFFEGLADDVGEAMLQAALDFLDDFGIGLLHVGDALDDFDLLLARAGRREFRWPSAAADGRGSARWSADARPE